MKLLIICFTALCILVLFFLLFSLFLFRRAHVRRAHYPADKRSHGGNRPLPPQGSALLETARAWLDTQSLERVTVHARDGLRLCADLLRAQEGKGVVLCFHGYHSSPRRDLTVQAKILHEAGYHVLLVYQRAHGDSEGTYICFGAKERSDVLAWCLWAESHLSDLPLYLLGLSMGASTVLMSANVGLPSSVRGIVADCGFSSPFEIIANTLHRKHKIYPYPAIYGMELWSRLLAGFGYRQFSCAACLKHSSLPVLMIHGEEDRYVPVTMSRQTAKAFPRQVELWTVPAAPHAQSVYYDHTGYRERLLSFLNTHK